jgi:hypothetical protein
MTSMLATALTLLELHDEKKKKKKLTTFLILLKISPPF